MAKPKTFKKKKDYTPMTAQEKEEKMNNFLQERGQQIVDMLQNYDPNKMIWNNPIFSIRFTNPASGVRYNSYNSMVLASQMAQRKTEEEIFPFFMTYKQAADQGMQVKKGSKGYTIVKKFGKKIGEYKVKDEETKEEKSVDLYRSSRSLDNVFNISDMDGEPSAKMKMYMDFGKTPASSEEVKVILEALIETSPVSIERKYLGEKATCYYSPTTDKINMAPSATFASGIEEVSTLAHEIGHAYGDERRYNRTCAKLYHTDKKYRAEEELVANLTALAIVNHFGLTSTESEKEEAFLKNHDAYDVGWATHLKSNPEVIFEAADAADKTSGKMIEEIENLLITKLKANPNLAVSDFIKDRLNNKEAKMKNENEASNDNTFKRPKIA